MAFGTTTWRGIFSRPTLPIASRKRSHSSIKSLDKFSSHSISAFHNRCIRSLPTRITGAASPSGSNIRAIRDNTCRLVGTDISEVGEETNSKSSFTGSHINPRVCSLTVPDNLRPTCEAACLRKSTFSPTVCEPRLPRRCNRIQIVHYPRKNSFGRSQQLVDNFPSHRLQAAGGLESPETGPKLCHMSQWLIPAHEEVETDHFSKKSAEGMSDIHSLGFADTFWQYRRLTHNEAHGNEEQSIGGPPEEWHRFSRRRSMTNRSPWPKHQKPHGT
ncbi:uncharacterized protein LOC129743381 [Uranotaenia lowii]|uniref:uncharacterized protein LOC129743381 n=1 Tax=Uranotaenia lowii TaxID=190385 RepID=UPI00247AC904|nr:uncharacterized protein LOC129743381 [Uranotaenia lowii]